MSIDAYLLHLQLSAKPDNTANQSHIPYKPGRLQDHPAFPLRRPDGWPLRERRAAPRGTFLASAPARKAASGRRPSPLMERLVYSLSFAQSRSHREAARSG